MSRTPVPPDAVDRLLTDFYTSQVRRPWPPAPAVGRAEPAASVAARGRAADGSTRARLTLAASVALLVGGCWYLSGGLHPADRGVTRPRPAVGLNPFPDTSASTPDAIKARQREKAARTADPMKGFEMP